MKLVFKMHDTFTVFYSSLSHMNIPKLWQNLLYVKEMVLMLVKYFTNALLNETNDVDIFNKNLSGT